MHVLLTAVIVVCAAALGLAAGTSLASTFLVPAGSGLAGPVEALGYGLLVAGVAAIAAGVLVWRLDARALMRVFLVAVLVTGAIAGVLYLRYQQLSAARVAQEETETRSTTVTKSLAPVVAPVE
ncbi:MAG: hypothetical protein KF769_10835 [Parvibaculum sp.]|nr:hypothetical protein [Parvibaculum sp.]